MFLYLPIHPAVQMLDNPNLSYDMWPERFQVTSIGVSAATQQAWRMSEPGIVHLDRRLDYKLVRESLRHGLWRPQPLEARPGDDPELLAGDLAAFTPS